MRELIFRARSCSAAHRLALGRWLGCSPRCATGAEGDRGIATASLICQMPVAVAGTKLVLGRAFGAAVMVQNLFKGHGLVFFLHFLSCTARTCRRRYRGKSRRKLGWWREGRRGHLWSLWGTQASCQGQGLPGGSRAVFAEQKHQPCSI